MNTAVTHGCKNFEEKKEKVAGRENQKIHGSILKDLVEKAWHAADTGKASSMTLRGMYEDKQG